MLLIDQLKEIYIDATLNAIDTAQWYPTVMRKDYTIGLTVSENGLDDPDQQFYENFVCGAERNYTGYCSPEVDKLIDQQSMESDIEKRQADRLGDRAPAGRGRRAAGDLLPGLGGLLAALLQGPHDDGQRQLQRLASGRRLARPVGPHCSQNFGGDDPAMRRRRLCRRAVAAADLMLSG